jgi:hypothetical protein
VVVRRLVVEGSQGGLEVGGLDEAEGQQPRRLAVVTGAVGFDKAAVGGLTAAVLLDLALELLQRGASHAVHLLPWWWLAVGGASVHGGFRVRARPPGPWSGHAGGVPGVAAHRDWPLSGVWGWSGSVTSKAQCGHSQRTTSALGCCLVGPTWASTSAAVAVGLPHNGHGRGTDLVALIGAPRPGPGSGRRWP